MLRKTKDLVNKLIPIAKRAAVLATLSQPPYAPKDFVSIPALKEEYSWGGLLDLIMSINENLNESIDQTRSRINYNKQRNDKKYGG